MIFRFRVFVFSDLLLVHFKQHYNPTFLVHLRQRRSEGTSSVAFEVVIMNRQIDFINLFIFNCLTLNINLLIFNCLTSKFCSQKTYLSQVEENKKTRKVEEKSCLWTRVLSFGY